MLTVTSEVNTAIQNDHTYCHLVQIDFNGGTVRLTDAGYDMTYSGNTFLANGQLLDVDDIKETSDLRVNEIGITLTAVTQSLLAILLQNSQIGREVTISRAYIDDTTGQPINNPIPLTTSQISGFAVSTSSQGESSLQLKIASEFADWERTTGRRTTEASQQKIYPNDRGMEFATQVQQEQQWGGE